MTRQQGLGEACFACAYPRIFRRGMCRTCHRKLSGCGVLPTAAMDRRTKAYRNRGYTDADAALRAWFLRMAPEQRAALLSRLAAIVAAEIGPPPPAAHR